MRRTSSILSKGAALGCAALLWAASHPLHAVDGVVEINQASASAGSTLFMINAPGSYRLTSNLTALANVTGILVNADDVTIDLNGFTIRGGGGASFVDGISAGGRTNVEIRNGAIRGFSRYGLYAPNSNMVRVIDVRATGNAFDGIRLESIASVGGFLIQGCSANQNGRNGISISGAGGLVVGNVVRSNTSFGLSLSGSHGYADNVLTGNAGGGSQVVGGLSIGCNLLETTVVCPP